MSDTSPPSGQPVRARDARALALTLELDPNDDSAMVRVLTLLARRRCIVVRASFAHDCERGCSLLGLELEAPRQRRDNLIAWLSGLVPVRSVRVRSGPQHPTPPAPLQPYETERRKRLAASA